MKCSKGIDFFFLNKNSNVTKITVEKNILKKFVYNLIGNFQIDSKETGLVTMAEKSPDFWRILTKKMRCWDKKLNWRFKMQLDWILVFQNVCHNFFLNFSKITKMYINDVEPAILRNYWISRYFRMQESRYVKILKSLNF